MSIFVTGDIHASYDIAKLSESCFDTAGLTKDDYVIICGDFGLVWNNSASEQYWLRWLDARPFTTLFVDGNHEGFSLLNSPSRNHMEWRSGTSSSNQRPPPQTGPIVQHRRMSNLHDGRSNLKRIRQDASNSG